MIEESTRLSKIKECEYMWKDWLNQWDKEDTNSSESWNSNWLKIIETYFKYFGSVGNDPLKFHLIMPND